MTIKSFKIYADNKLKEFWLVFIPIALALLSNLHWSGFYYSHDVPKWLFIDLLLSVFVFAHRERVGFVRAYISTVFLLTVYWIAITLLWASHVYAGLEFLFRFALFGVAFSLLISCYTSDQRCKLLLHSSVVSASLFVFVFCIERWIGVPVSNGAFTPIGFTNNAGHVFNIWIPALCYLTWKSKSNYLLCFVALCTLIGILYVLNISHIRTTVIAIAIGVFLLLLIRSRRYIHQIPFAHKRVVITIIALSILGLLAMQTKVPLPRTISQSLTTIENPIENYRPRLNMVVNSWDMLRDNPFGVGANNFEFIHPEYARAGTKHGSDYVNERQILKTPHNFLTKVSTELGWVGTALFLAIYIWLVSKTLSLALYREKQGWIFVASIAFLLHSLMSQVFLSPMSYVFAILLFSSLVNTTRRSPEHTTSKLASKLSIVVLILPALSIMTVVSHFYHYQGVHQRDISKIEKAVSIYPGNEVAWFDLSRSYFRDPQDLDSAIWASEKFLALNPNHIYGRYFYSELLVYRRNCSGAVKTLTELLSHYPSYLAAQSLMTKALDCRAREQNKLLTQR